MERQITIIRKTAKARPGDTPEVRRERRVQVVNEAGACSISGCCGSDDCCADGTICTCLCGCQAAEITEEDEDGHTLIKIRVPKVVRDGEDDALVKAAGVSGAVENLGGEIGKLVRRAREQGASWTDIGAALGISKQAAWERFSGEE